MAPSFDDHTTSSSSRATTTTTTKCRKLTALPYQPLLPGLPDHIASQCLSLLPPTTLYSVSRAWRRFIYSDSFPAFLSLYALSSDQDSTLQLSSFDPISSQWTTVVAPPLPTTHIRRVISLRHPKFISRNLPIQSVSVSGHLVLLAATTSDLLPAISHPLVFNPRSKIWSFGPPLSTPRRWCVAGVSRASVVVASGIGSRFSQTVSHAVEKWVFPETESFDGKRKDSKWGWKKMRSLINGKFSREAIDAVGSKGKLYMVNVKGACAKEGVVYDVDSDGWSEMAAGMLGGWRGPAAAMDEEIIYMVDESKGVLRKYDDLMEVWVDVLENDMLKGAEHIAAGGGRVCVVCGGGVGILVVDTLAGHQVLALHVLPRMCSPELQSPVVV